MLDSRRWAVPLLFALAACLAQPALAQEGGGGGRGPGGERGAGPGDAGRAPGGPEGARGRGGFGHDRPAPSPSILPPQTDTVTLPFPTDEPGFAPEPGAVSLPDLSGFAPSAPSRPLARPDHGITLAARLTDDGGDIPKGLVWRVFSPKEDNTGALPLLASARGGTSTFDLPQGSYLVHAAFGRAGATMRVTVGANASRQTLVLDAGGLELDAVVSGDRKIAPGKVRFSIFETQEDATGERALVVPDVSAGTIVRLNAGTYHIVSTYGDVNAVIRSDIRVEAGKLTEATVEHRAADLTFKLVRETGGEALADTSWSVLTDGGDLVRESVGAYASMVLAEGSYTVVAKNRERIYQRDIEVAAGDNKDVEVLTTDTPAAAPAGGEISD